MKDFSNLVIKTKMKFTFVAGKNRHNLNARVEVVDDCSCALKLHSMNNRLERVEENFWRDEADDVRVQLDVVVDGCKVFGASAFFLFSLVNLPADDTRRHSFNNDAE